MDPKALRTAYGRFMTGVVVAITEAADGDASVLRPTVLRRCL